MALLSKTELSDIMTTFPGCPESDPYQARFIQARLSDRTIVISVYVPNGTAPMNNPTDTSRLEFKIQWLDALTEHLKNLIAQGEQIILGGDFNVIERDTDVYNYKSFLVFFLHHLLIY